MVNFQEIETYGDMKIGAFIKLYIYEETNTTFCHIQNRQRNLTIKNVEFINLGETIKVNIEMIREPVEREGI